MYFRAYKDVGGYWRWTLFAANHHKIANSGEGYYNKSDALAAINLVKSSAAAPVYEAAPA